MWKMYNIYRDGEDGMNCGKLCKRWWREYWKVGPVMVVSNYVLIFFSTGLRIHLLVFFWKLYFSLQFNKKNNKIGDVVVSSPYLILGCLLRRNLHAIVLKAYRIVFLFNHLKFYATHHIIYFVVLFKSWNDRQHT